MIRTLLIIVWTVMVTIFWGGLTILASFLSKNSAILYKFPRFWAQSILFACGIKVNATGLSDINPQESYIYMPNHVSNFDIPVLMEALPGPFRWLAKAELFRIPLFGYAMKRVGSISIDRSNRESAIASLSQAARIIRKGESILIFPEGTRSPDGKIMSFKKGGFFLAVDTQIPIVPVTIRGTGAIMPKNRIRIQPQDVAVEFKKPVQTAGYDRQTIDDLMGKIRNLILQSFVNTAKERPLC